MKKECIVYPTSRCIRHALTQHEFGLIPHMFTMGEFLGRVLISPHLIPPDDDLRLLALHEASDFNAFSALHIERNFFSFMQNSQYLFRFFEELSSEEVEISSLEVADIYGEYEEHITILGHLRGRYEQLCLKNHWLDPIFLSQNIHINHDFLQRFDCIHIEVEGYLTRREMTILQECATSVEVEIRYTATAYNRKMTQRFIEIGVSLEEDCAYVFSLNTLNILSQEPLVNKRLFTCEVLPSRLAQIGFIKARICEMVDAGVAPENIVVIVPDESFASFIKHFDGEENFNFAMGESFTTHILFRTLEAIVLFLEEPNVQNQARIQKISQVKIQWLKERYFLPYTHAMLCALIEMLSDDEVHELVVDELHRFSHLEGALIQMDFKSIVRIFMNRLQTLTLDDVSGGKITVMGLLETRGMSYEGVIVVDFNEGFVPHKSQKDLFLNTKTRLHASLPTSSDREGLQKHYYSMLFNRAKKVFVACVQNSESVPSRFLLQLGISSITAACAYERVLFDAVANPIREVEEIQSDYDFKQHPLSASGLKSFLTCKRQFYYGRIAKIKEHELPRDLSQERDIGNILHQKLELLYAKQPRYENASALKSALSEVWESQGDDALGRYTKRLWLEKLDPFYDNEANRFSQGYSVAYIEKEGLATVEGISLVGRMDRIDERKGVLEVIDYKSGKFADTTKPPKESDVDYQLSVYALMAREFGEVGACGYYDLSCGELKAEQFLEDKIESLKKILRDMGSKNTWTWSLSEDVSSCRYCPYTYLCHREAYRGI